MNRRLLVVLLIAFLIAGLSSLVVYRLVGNRVAFAHQGNKTRVVTATADLKLGTILTSANISTTEVAGAPPKGAILKPENAIGRGVVANLYQGETILEDRLAPVGSGGGLAATIRPGMRACAVKVDEVVGVAGFVTPGMRVDVIISGNPPNQTNNAQGTLVKTLLQNVEVLSAGTDIQKDTEGKPQQVRVVNLLVTPEQAEVLALASNPNDQTHIQLVLRNPLDTELAKVPGSGMANLFASENGPTPTLSFVRMKHSLAPKADVVEVFIGSQRTLQRIGSPEGK